MISFTTRIPGDQVQSLVNLINEMFQRVIETIHAIEYYNLHSLCVKLININLKAVQKTSPIPVQVNINEYNSLGLLFEDNREFVKEHEHGIILSEFMMPLANAYEKVTTENFLTLIANG